ncbi:MAG: hypothetical protein CL579_05245 [Alteromonadaceae bacterium]|nr:hypothetical protein [Alteromonadaceae bacterium]MBB21010.1 hypothetical protein [Rickettsiales bacterium]
MKYSVFSTVIWFYCRGCLLTANFCLLSCLTDKPSCHIAVVLVLYNRTLAALTHNINNIM